MIIGGQGHAVWPAQLTAAALSGLQSKVKPLRFFKDHLDSRITGATATTVLLRGGGGRRHVNNGLLLPQQLHDGASDVATAALGIVGYQGALARGGCTAICWGSWGWRCYKHLVPLQFI